MISTETDINKITISFWEKRTGREYSSEDAREMIENISGFIHLLDEWDRKAQKEKK